MTHHDAGDVTDQTFNAELARRLPLALAVLEAFRFAFDDAHLEQLYEANRGRSYTGVLEFPRFVAMVRDCLLQHGGSGNRMCGEAERAGTLAVDQSSFYRKLGNAPVALSRALLRECTAHLTELMPSPPPADVLPGCFAAFDEVVVIDGKKVKDAAKRLKPTRGYGGSLLGAKALVAMALRRGGGGGGLAIAMSDSLDGEANDVPLVPDLLPQVRAVIAGPVLFTADRQFGDLGVPRLLAARDGDHYVLRLRNGLTFTPADPQVPSGTARNEQGREVIDEVGMLGKGKDALRVRRVTLRRTDAAGKADDVVLITDLLDRDAYPADDLLALYRHRWGIEQMFQQVTETFSLKHLIGCGPRAVLFQFALCLLMYNLIQVVKAYVAQDGQVERASVSTANLFYDVKRELQTWSYFALAAPVAAARESRADIVRQRLRALLAGSWDPVAYTKAADKRPRPPRPGPRRLHGGHTSVQRLLDGTGKLKQ